MGSNYETSKTFTDSKTVAGAKYEPSTKVLTITFVTGKQYTYKDVPEQLWISLINAESVGQFVNNHIKGQYEYKLIN